MSSKEAVPMHWLKRPALSAAATWGVPWAEGSLRREEELSLHNPSKPVPPYPFKAGQPLTGPTAVLSGQPMPPYWRDRVPRTIPLPKGNLQ